MRIILGISRKYWLGGAIICALLIEVFIFNYQYWCAKNYEPTTYQFSTLEGIDKQDEYYELIGDDKSAYGLSFTELNCNIKNIHIKAAKENTSNDPGETALKVNILASDEGNAILRKLPERTIVEGVVQTEYIKLDLSGKCKDLSIVFNEQQNTRIAISEIVFNTPHPFIFSSIRFGIVFVVLAVLLGGKRIWAFINLSEGRNVSRNLVITVFIVAHIVLFWQVAHMNAFFRESPRAQDTQYWELTDSILKGQTWLEDAPSEELVSLENPYDTNYRISKVGWRFRWDVALYNGKYYVYFGIGPVLLFYLPYKLLFHKYLDHIYIIFLCSIIAMCGMMRILWLIRKRFCPKTDFASYLLTCLVAVNSCGTLLLLKRTDFYSVPVITGIMLSLVGLSLILDAEINKRNIILKTIAGAVCLAFVAACRPQLLMSSFLILFIYNLNIKDPRCIFRSKRVLCIIIPYIVIAAGLMYYNAIRFSSPFDFGANYNLTTNDMTSRGFAFGRIGYGLFEFLLQPVNISVQFPFLTQVNNSNLYMGTTIAEKMFGGVFLLNPLLLLGFGKGIDCGTDKDQTRLRRAKTFLVIASIIVVIVDTQMAGVLERYQADFLWMLTLAASPGLLYSFSEAGKTNNDKLKKMILWGMLSVFIVFAFLQLFVTNSFSIRETNPQLFYLWFHRIQFWL